VARQQQKNYLYADNLQFLLEVTEKDETESSVLGEGKDESTETLTKLTALQAPIAILSVGVTADLGFTSGKTISVPVPTPILSVRVRPPLQWLSDATSTEC
jgi:hypothetical protein